MNLKISLDEDIDLRNFIKDQLRGQIDALAREDLKAIILNEITRKLEAKSDYFDRILTEVVHKWFQNWATIHKLEDVTKALFNEYIVGSLGKIMVEKDWTNVIEEMARKEIIRSQHNK